MRKSDDLKAEYLLIQSHYEACDQRALTMEALATPAPRCWYSLWFQGAEHYRATLTTILLAASLWLFEANWKDFQYCLTDRVIRLEEWFRG